jgi:hypothetical protein
MSACGPTRARAKPDLTDWWFSYLTDEQRERLLDEVGEPLDPDLALELWRGSRSVRVVEPEVWQVGADPGTCRLTVAAATFVAAGGARARSGGAGARSVSSGVAAGSRPGCRVADR